MLGACGHAPEDVRDMPWRDVQTIMLVAQHQAAQGW